MNIHVCIMGNHKMRGTARGLFGEEARNGKKAVNIALHECEAILSSLKPTVSVLTKWKSKVNSPKQEEIRRITTRLYSLHVWNYEALRTDYSAQ